jgi:hypothetical protein
MTCRYRTVLLSSALIYVTIVLSFTSAVHAAETGSAYDMTAFTGTHGGSSKNDKDVSPTGIGQTDNVTNVEIANTGENSGSNAIAIGYAEYGSLHAQTVASAYMNLAGIPDTYDREITLDQNPSGAQSDTQVWFRDALTFSGLPLGTPIDVVVGFALHDYANGNMPQGGGGSGLALIG